MKFTYTYFPRGWVASETVTGGTQTRLTKYTYDGTGQLKTATLPDLSVVTFGYDDAHRLTTITDILGNKITYELDPMGNRKVKKITDPSGVLARQTTWIYDALNRVQTSTGEIN
ncbi:RHS repeat protein [Massilia sp. H-1]|nr:RHS repeat protein [Massilia sp. H-1]